jgi:hypothetical protein
MRKHLTYANVMATIAVVGVLGGGAAYAANTIRSSDIVDGEVKAADLANNSVRSEKIANNQIRSADVNELHAFFEATSAGGACSADDGAPVECLSTPITVERPGRLLVDATAAWHTFALDDTQGVGLGSDDTTLVRGRCRLQVDGATVGDPQAAGERASTNSVHPTDAPGAMALTGLSVPLAAGSHAVALVCVEEDGDLDWQNINLTAGLVAG